jgi:cation diffusion facilitator family transporter
MIEGFFSDKKKAIGVSFVLAVFIMSLKFYAYFLTDSKAILTDAAESIVNIIATAFAMYSLYLAEKPKDYDHPYGHGKIEFFSSGLEGFLILLAGVFTLIPALNALIVGTSEIRNIWNGISITVTVVLLNGLLGYILIKYGNKLNSIILEADGKHLLLDAISSVVLVFGLILVQFTGIQIIDPILAIFLAVYIFYNGIQILRKAISGLMDETDFELLNKLIKIINENRKNEWVDVHNFRVKKYGADIHIDSHITLPYYLSLKESHEEVNHFEEIIRKDTHHDLEVFVHSDPCIPACCSYCRMKDCKQRTSDFERDVIWDAKRLVNNQKHFEY